MAQLKSTNAEEVEAVASELGHRLWSGGFGSTGILRVLINRVAPRQSLGFSLVGDA